MHSMMFGNISGLYPLGASGELSPRVAKMSLILPDVPGKVISPVERTTRGNCFFCCCCSCKQRETGQLFKKLCIG